MLSMRALALLSLTLVACGEEPPPPPDAAVDLAATQDQSVDLGFDATAILGTLSGECRALLGELTAPGPSLLKNTLTFVGGERYERSALTPGGQRLYDTPNAGGSSTESEVMSHEVLHFCAGAALVKTETEIGYGSVDGGNAQTDILLGFAGQKLGVSVTRTYKPGGMNDSEVQSLLERKLGDIIQSSRRVLPGDRWLKQILHVFAPNPQAEAAIERVLPNLAAVRADTVIFVTRTSGGGFIYCDPDPALGSECPNL